jgi:hypothetical protein
MWLMNSLAVSPPVTIPYTTIKDQGQLEKATLKPRDRETVIAAAAQLRDRIAGVAIPHPTTGSPELRSLKLKDGKAMALPALSNASADSVSLLWNVHHDTRDMLIELKKQLDLANADLALSPKNPVMLHDQHIIQHLYDDFKNSDLTDRKKVDALAKTVSDRNVIGDAFHNGQRRLKRHLKEHRVLGVPVMGSLLALKFALGYMVIKLIDHFIKHKGKAILNGGSQPAPIALSGSSGGPVALSGGVAPMYPPAYGQYALAPQQMYAQAAYPPRVY